MEIPYFLLFGRSYFVLCVDVALGLRQLFVERANVTYLVHRFPLSDVDPVILQMQTKETSIHIISRLLQDMKLAQQKKAVGRDKDLNAALTDVENGLGDQFHKLRIQIGLRFVPEEVTFI